LEVEKWPARRAIEPVQRFLLGQPRLELMHLQLRKVLVEEFSLAKRLSFRQKLLNWCRRYEGQGWPKETPDYILAHYAQHLIEAEQDDTLYALINKRWMELKFERTFSHRSFADDVERAINLARAEEPPNLVRITRNCLIYATLGTLATNVPPKILEVLAQVGQVERALNYAGLMQDVERRGLAYFLIDRALPEQGNREVAKQAVVQVLLMTERMTDDWKKTQILRGAIQALAQMGELEPVLLMSMA
jgi:hypothetical protein